LVSQGNGSRASPAAASGRHRSAAHPARARADRQADAAPTGRARRSWPHVTSLFAMKWCPACKVQRKTIRLVGACRDKSEGRLGYP
jgi:hypothetical protein